MMKNVKYIIFLIVLGGCSLNEANPDEPLQRDDSIIVTHQVEIDSENDSLYQTAADYVRDMQYKKAETIYSHLLKIEDDKTNAFAGMAAVHLLLNRTDEAIANYDALIDLDSMNYLGQLGLGSCYYTKNDFKLAISHYRKAILSSPGTADPYRGLAISYSELNEKDSAASNAKRFLILAPNTSHRRGMEDLINGY